jgi:hypothetical protein
MDAAILVQVQLEILSLSLLVASLKEEEANGSKEEQARLTAPESVKKAAQLGISLYEQYGGRKELRLPQALAQEKPITFKDIDEMLDFFENSQIDHSKPGWGNKEYPSVDWIRWLLMGGNPGWHWASTTKQLASAMNE